MDSSSNFGAFDANTASGKARSEIGASVVAVVSIRRDPVAALPNSACTCVDSIVI